MHVKDAASMWWDPTASNDGGAAGAWRMFEGGRRYVSGRWAPGDAYASKSDGDPVNAFPGTYWFCC